VSVTDKSVSVFEAAGFKVAKKKSGLLEWTFSEGKEVVVNIWHLKSATRGSQKKLKRYSHEALLVSLVGGVQAFSAFFWSRLRSQTFQYK
jgi:hypothetical protein